MVDASEECVKVTNNNKLTEDNNDGLTPARAAPCGGGTGLMPAQQNRGRR